MAEPLLTKDTVNIAGHKVPIALLGVLVAVAGVFLFMRARSSGSSVAVGAQPTAAGPDPGVLGTGAEAQFANLSQQLAGLQMQLNPAAPAPVITASPDVFQLRVRGTSAGYDLGPAQGLPLYTKGPGGFQGIGEVPYGSTLPGISTGETSEQGAFLVGGHSLGMAGFYPVNYQGQQYYLSAADVAGITHRL